MFLLSATGLLCGSSGRVLCYDIILLQRSNPCLAAFDHQLEVLPVGTVLL